MQVYLTKISQSFQRNKLKKEITALNIEMNHNLKEGIAISLIVAKVKFTIKIKWTNFFTR
jgi:hypothetical protein